MIVSVLESFPSDHVLNPIDVNKDISETVPSYMPNTKSSRVATF